MNNFILFLFSISTSIESIKIKGVAKPFIQPITKYNIVMDDADMKSLISLKKNNGNNNKTAMLEPKRINIKVSGTGAEKRAWLLLTN
ncbi:MAG: hypothetical protein GY714_12465 [Desulfobacterales bacterium]|nr:hypothetical protein [Desulfobacterales bacterium]MCP4162745.1 hypothetical protein [Deltaproteobacteria bacterium]